jgi:type I restriction enzyme M protein
VILLRRAVDDGFTLDDKRAKIGDGKGDLPDVLAKYRQWCGREGDFADRATKAFEVSAADIAA